MVQTTVVLYQPRVYSSVRDTILVHWSALLVGSLEEMAWRVFLYNVRRIHMCLDAGERIYIPHGVHGYILQQHTQASQMRTYSSSPTTQQQGLRGCVVFFSDTARRECRVCMQLSLINIEISNRTPLTVKYGVRKIARLVAVARNGFGMTAKSYILLHELLSTYRSCDP